MKAAKTWKILKEMPYPPQKMLLKRKGNSVTPAKTNAPISQNSSERLKLTKGKIYPLWGNFEGAAKISTIFYQ